MIDIHNLKSPISGESGVKEIFKIPSEFIVKSYLRDFNIDTAHFFEGVDNIYLLQCEQTGYKFYYPLNLAGDGDFYTHFKKALGVNY